jgi:hypothetical protein
MVNQKFHQSKYPKINNGFWDKKPQDRSRIMAQACKKNGIKNFFDLSPEERAEAYEKE